MTGQFVRDLLDAVATGDSETLKALGRAAKVEFPPDPGACPCDGGLVFYRDQAGRSRVGGCYRRCCEGAVPFGAPLCDPETGQILIAGHAPPKDDKRK